MKRGDITPGRRAAALYGLLALRAVL